MNSEYENFGSGNSCRAGDLRFRFEYAGESEIDNRKIQGQYNERYLRGKSPTPGNPLS